VLLESVELGTEVISDRERRVVAGQRLSQSSSIVIVIYICIFMYVCMYMYIGAA